MGRASCHDDPPQPRKGRNTSAKTHGEIEMSLFKSMGSGGNPTWVDTAEVIALENFYSDRTLYGEAENAKLLTRIHLRSGAFVEVDANIEQLAMQIGSTTRQS